MRANIKRAARAIDEFSCSPYFIGAFVLAESLSYIFSGELVFYTCCVIYFLFQMACCEHMHPLIVPFFLLYFSPSAQNNPGRNPESIYYPENGLWYIVALGALALCALIVRIAVRCRSGAVPVSAPKFLKELVSPPR